MIESSWLRAIEIGERPELQDTVRGRGSFLAAHNLAVLHDGLGATPGRALARARGGVSRRGLSAAAEWRAERPFRAFARRPPPPTLSP